MRNKRFFFYLFPVWLLLAAAPSAEADLIQDLTANIACNSCTSTFFPGYPQDPPHYYIAPAHGSASFAQLGLPWEFSFITALPIDWLVNGNIYGLTFGQGGVFDMTGPFGEIFTGVVESGLSYHELGHATISLHFSGQWSNGWDATGSISQTYTAGQNPIYTAELQTQPSIPAVPEPGYFLLYGGGALAAWKLRRRF